MFCLFMSFISATSAVLGLSALSLCATRSFSHLWMDDGGRIKAKCNGKTILGILFYPTLHPTPYTLTRHRTHAQHATCNTKRSVLTVTIIYLHMEPEDDSAASLLLLLPFSFLFLFLFHILFLPSRSLLCSSLHVKIQPFQQTLVHNRW